MYPLTCVAGFPMPLKVGGFEICAFTCAAQDAALAIELAVYDDEDLTQDAKVGRILPNDDDYKVKLFHRKGIATYGVQMDSPVFSEPIKVRHGISVYTSNVKGGSLCIYTR